MGVNFAYKRVHSKILHMSQDSNFRSLDSDTLYVSIYSTIIQQIKQIIRNLKTAYDFLKATNYRRLNIMPITESRAFICTSEG